jgi:hypothetical protein
VFNKVSLAQFKHFPSIPSFRVRLWIVDRKVQLQGIVVDTAEAFNQVQFVAMRSAQMIKPCLFVKTDSVNHECIALIPADRIAPPG